MQLHVSTRGEAPRTGLRGRCCWRVLRATAGFTCRRPGRSFRPRPSPPSPASRSPRSPSALLQPFVGGAIPRARAARAWPRDAYAALRPPRRDAAGADRPQPWVLELFHGPTLAFKDVAMQLLARLMDRVLAARGKRVHHRRRDVGRHRRRRHRGVPRLEPRRRRRAVPAGPHLRRAAAHDDDADRAQRPRRRHRGHLRRLPGAGEGDVQRPAPSATACSWRASTPSTGRASWRRSPTISSPPPPSAARTAAVAFSVPTGNFGDIFAGYVAKRMGLPIERLVIATNENDILRAHARHRRLRAAERGGDHLAVHGHPGLLQLRALPVRGRRPRRRLRARQDGRACAKSADSSCRRRRSRPIASDFIADRAERGRGRRLHPARARRESGYLLDPHTRLRRRRSARRR